MVSVERSIVIDKDVSKTDANTDFKGVACFFEKHQTCSYPPERMTLSALFVA